MQAERPFDALASKAERPLSWCVRWFTDHLQVMTKQVVLCNQPGNLECQPKKRRRGVGRWMAHSGGEQAGETSPACCQAIAESNGDTDKVEDYTKHNAEAQHLRETATGWLQALAQGCALHSFSCLLGSRYSAA